MFEGYSDLQEEVSAQQLPLSRNSESIVGASPADRSVCDYYDRWKYSPNRNDVTKIKGSFRPSTYSNPYGYMFHTYHETETEWQDKDYVEFIYEYRKHANGQNQQYVWLAVWENNTWETGYRWMAIPVQSAQQINYYCYFISSENDEKYYYLWLQDAQYGYWYGTVYTLTSSNPQNIKGVNEVSEFYPSTPVGTGFSVISRIQVTGLATSTSGWLVPASVLQYQGRTLGIGNGQYVQTTCSLYSSLTAYLYTAYYY